MYGKYIYESGWWRCPLTNHSCLQPPLLVQRFILNLRQLNHTVNTNSDAQHFSRFSVSFRVPPNFIGNIGEPLDNGQSEREVQEDSGDDDSCVAREPRDGLEERFTQQAGLQVVCQDNSVEAGSAVVLRSAQRSSDGDIIESFAYSDRMVIRPFTSAR